MKKQETRWQLELTGRTSRLHFEHVSDLRLMISTAGHVEELRNWKDAAAQAGDPAAVESFASGVEVLWAGDLNEDERIDVLLKQGDAEIGVSVELFLSSGPPLAPRWMLADRFDSGAC